MSKTIRQYNPSDQPSVKSVILNGLKEFGFEYTPEYDFDLEDPEKYYLKKGGMFYILEIDGKVVGTVAVVNRGDTAELKRLYVNKDYQGKGLGSQLFDTALQFCRDNGFKKVEFETNKKFEKAHLLYRKRGFKTVREDENSYYMERELK